MGGGDSEPSEPGEVWKAVLRPQYAAARARHATERAEAYEVARELMLERGICGPELRIADIDAHTLEVWRSTWRGVHPSGAGSWNWPSLVERLPHRAAVLRYGIWYDGDLCGLALGQASRARANRSRHTVSLTYVERRPEPPAVLLRGYIILIAVEVALRYGRAIGAQRLRLRNPDVNLLGQYQRTGFNAVWKGGIPIYCEREVWI
jgi:hypothetical protein